MKRWWITALACLSISTAAAAGEGEHAPRLLAVLR